MKNRRNSLSPVIPSLPWSRRWLVALAALALGTAVVSTAAAQDETSEPKKEALDTRFNQARGGRNARPVSAQTSLGATLSFDRGSVSQVGRSRSTALMILDGEVCQASPKQANGEDDLAGSLKDQLAEALRIRSCFQLKVPLKLLDDEQQEQAGVGNLAFAMAGVFDFSVFEWRIGVEATYNPTDSETARVLSPILSRYYKPSSHSLTGQTSIGIKSSLVDVRADLDVSWAFDNEHLLGIGGEGLGYGFVLVGVTASRVISSWVSATLGVDYLGVFGVDSPPAAIVMAAPGVRLNVPQVNVGLSVPLLLSADDNVKNFYDFGLMLDASYAF